MHEKFGDRKEKWVQKPFCTRVEARCLGASEGHCRKSTWSVISSLPCHIGRSTKVIPDHLLICVGIIQVLLGS